MLEGYSSFAVLLEDWTDLEGCSSDEVSVYTVDWGKETVDSVKSIVSEIVLELKLSFLDFVLLFLNQIPTFSSVNLHFLAIFFLRVASG